MSDILEAIVDRIGQAAAAGRPVAIAAGGSKGFFGRVPDGDLLDLSAHRGITHYEPAELVLTARAGTPIADIETALAGHGQTLAFEPPRFGGRATLGGTLACNASGPARPWRGSIRDAVLGVRLVNGRGRPLAFGGRVMKNVAGFDLSRLQAGALGAFGVLTEITVKVLPRPEATETLVYELDARAAIARMNTLAATPRPLTGAAWRAGRMYLRLAGSSAAVAATARAWGGERSGDDSFWQALREHELPELAGTGPLWRFSIASTAALDGLDDAALVDWCGAQRFVAADLDAADAAAAAASAGGHASLYRGGDRRGEVAPPLPAPLAALHRRVKDAFDPARIVNRGRLYSWL